MEEVRLTCRCCQQRFPIEQNTSLDGMAAMVRGLGVCYGCSATGDMAPTPEEIEVEIRGKIDPISQARYDGYIEALRGQDLLLPAHRVVFERMNYRSKLGLVTALVERGLL